MKWLVIRCWYVFRTQLDEKEGKACREQGTSYEFFWYLFSVLIDFLFMLGS